MSSPASRERPRAPTACRAPARPLCRSRSSISTPQQLRAYIEGADPISKRPFMQEIIEGAVAAARRGRSERPVVRALDTRAWSRPTPRTISSGCSSTMTGPTSAHHPADRRARRGDAQGHQPQARQGGRPHAPDSLPRILGVHRREGRGQRGHGGRQAGISPGHPGARRERRHRALDQHHLDGQ